MLQELAVTNYKSLREVSVRLKPLSILIGPNDSGKSNLLDSLKFIADFINIGQEAVTKRSGLATIVWSGAQDRRISFALKGRSEWKEKRYRFHYSLTFSGRDDRWFEVDREIFEVYHAGQFRKLMEFPGKDRLAYTYDLEGNQTGGLGHGDARSYLHDFSSDERYGQLGAFSSEVRQWEVYDLTPSLMRGRGPAKRELKLEPRGENLASVLHTLHSEYPDVFARIQEHIQVLVPESDQLLSLLTEEGQTYPGLKQSGLPLKVPASGISSGTLRFLALLTALYSPAAPSLICFEEPENYIHPHGLELIVDLLRRASLKRQVIATTHSPYLLNFVDPACVFVIEKLEGETRVTAVETKKNLKSLLREVGMGEAWYAGSVGGVPRSAS